MSFQVGNNMDSPFEEPLNRRSFMAMLGLGAVDLKGTLDNLLSDKLQKSNLDTLLRVNERSEPYLPYIFEACEEYKNIFPVPPVFMGFLFQIESGYNPLAFSSVGALGIAQFMIPTARGMGMSTIDENEPYMKALTDAYNAWTTTNRKAQRAFNAYQFETAKKCKMQVPQLHAAYNQTYATTKRTILHKLRNGELDEVEQRHTVLALNKGTQLIANEARIVQLDYDLNIAYALLFAAAIYNAGRSRVIGRNVVHKGIPDIDETRNYVNKLIMMYGKYHKSI